MIYKLVISLIKYQSCITRICSLFLTPKNLVNLNLMTMSLSRFFYICYDPYCQHKKVSYQFDRIVNELTISSITSIYLLLFIVFVGLNANLQRGTRMISKRCFVCTYKTLKFIVIIVLFFIYPIQIFISYSNSTIDDINIPYVKYFYIGFCFLFFLLYLITFYVLCYLKKQFFKFYEMKKNINKNDIKVNVLENENLNIDHELQNYTINYEDETQSNFLNSHEDFEEIKKKNLVEKKKTKYIIEFLTNVIKDKNIDSISYILGKKDAEIQFENEFEKNDDKVYFENEMKILNQYYPENYHYDPDFTTRYTFIEQNSENLGIKQKILVKKKQKKINLIPPKINKSDDNDDFIMNENDRELVNNIFYYSFIYMIATAFYFFYFVVSRLNAIIRIHWIMIIIYIVFHIFDCFYIIIIYFVFFKNTSSQEYENLKYIGELENLIKGKFSNGKIKIVYDELAHSIIAERFKGFINFEN